MSNKIYKILTNYIVLLLMILFLFLPLFTLQDYNDGKLFESRLIFGFHFLTGVFTNADHAVIENVQVILQSSVVNIIPVLMLLTIFVIEKIIKENRISKLFIDIVCMAITFFMSFLLPVTAYQYLETTYQDSLEFVKIWGYYLNVILQGIVLIAFIVLFILKIREERINRAKNDK